VIEQSEPLVLFLPGHHPSSFSLKIPFLLLKSVGVFHHVMATFVHVLQEAYPINTHAVHFPENFCNTKLLRSLDNMLSYQVIAKHGAQYIHWKLLLKMALCYLEWFLSAQECKFLVLVMPPWVNWVSSMTTVSSIIWRCGCDHSHNHTGLAWSPNEVCLTRWRWQDRNYHGAELSIPVSVLHQSSCKCCTATRTSPSPCLYCSHLHSLVIRNQSPSVFCVQFQMFCEVGNIFSIPQQQPHHCYCRNHT